MNDIYELLKSGRSAEDIVAEFTKNLNAAEEQINKEAEEAKAREAAAKAEAEQRNELKAALTSLISWFTKYYPEYAEAEELDITDEDLDGIIELISSLLELEKLKASFTFGDKKKTFEKPTIRKTLPVKVELNTKSDKLECAKQSDCTVDDAFTKFFKELGLM
jgi:uncharacterized protein involved in exopolysaccharide biosynthesis